MHGRQGMDLPPEKALFLYNSGARAHEDAWLMIQDLYLTRHRLASVGEKQTARVQ
jgi:hypothetical protein